MKTHFHPIIQVFALTVLCVSAADTHARETTRVSVASRGEQANAGSNSPSLSADGRFVAFWSSATNLVPGDSNERSDIFVHDRLTGQTTRVSVSSRGEQASGWSGSPSLSADGRFVVFTSDADNLVLGDANGWSDVFIHDRLSHKTVRASVSSSGEQANSWSDAASLSADGRFVAFSSNASNLVPGDSNGSDDLFVHNRLTGQTTRVSVASRGEQANARSFLPSLSADGRFVAFSSSASNLVRGDSNGSDDVFVHDRATGRTTRVSVLSSGEQANAGSVSPSLSADGRFVAFRSSATNLVPGDGNGSEDIFVHDRLTGQTKRASVASSGEQANARSFFPSLSADGRFVAFESWASNLVPGDGNGGSDIFVHNRLTGNTERASVSSRWAQANAWNGSTSLSADGGFVAFRSFATNLVPRDTNSRADIFVHDRRVNRAFPADVGIRLTQQPDSLARLVPGRFAYTVTNHGPNPAKFIRIVHTVSNGKAVDFTPSQGRCQRHATISLCRLGELPANASLTLEMAVNAPGTAPLSQYLSVSAIQTDPVPDNNTIRVETPVTP